MNDLLQIIVTVVCAVIASSGFWAWLQRRYEKKDLKTKMLLGLAHDRIIFLCMQYIERGSITYDEYENLEKYLYTPYKNMGGNGTGEKLFNAVKNLPVKPLTFETKEG